MSVTHHEKLARDVAIETLFRDIRILQSQYKDGTITDHNLVTEIIGVSVTTLRELSSIEMEFGIKREINSDPDTDKYIF